MSNELDAYFARLRAGELASYYSELRRKEDEFQNTPLPNPMGDEASDVPPSTRFSIGSSRWYGFDGLTELRDIDDRYGILPTDPRVYSIAAYREESRAIEAECAQHIKDTKHIDGVDWEGSRRFSNRRADCEARHFPGIMQSISDPFNFINTMPKLWCYLEGKHSVIRRRIEKEPRNLDEKEYLSRLNFEFEGTILHLMLKLGVPWTPDSPGEGWNVLRLSNEILRFVRKLEADEMTYLSGLWLIEKDIPITAAPKRPRRVIGRKKVFDPKEDKRICDAWKSGKYPTYDRLALAQGMTKSAVKQALDRQRKR